MGVWNDNRGVLVEHAQPAARVLERALSQAQLAWRAWNRELG